MKKRLLPTAAAVFVCALLLVINFTERHEDLPAETAYTVAEPSEMTTAETADTTTATETTAETAAQTTVMTTVMTTAETTAEPIVDMTPPAPVILPEDLPEDPRAPVLEPPPMPEEIPDFYNDAAFIGDSVSVMLSWYAANGELGSPLFLTRESYSMAHAAWGTMLVQYDGMEMPPEDALAESGVKKVFIMLGMNDVAVYGIEKTIDHWNMVIPRILEKCPDIEIYVQSVTPIWTGGEVGALNNAHMDEFNLRLQILAHDYGFPYVDIASYLKDSTGGLASIYCSDGYVHLTNAGASAWVRVLLGYAGLMNNE